MTDTVSVRVRDLRSLFKHSRFDGDIEHMVFDHPDHIEYIHAKGRIGEILDDAEQNKNKTGMLERLLEKALHHIRQKRLSH